MRWGIEPAINDHREGRTLNDPMNLLIVDDDEGDRMLMQEAIGRMDMNLRISQASTDKEALEKLEA